jgi:hypothetical protein
MPTVGTAPGLNLRISIEDSEPLIWRRLFLPETLTIGQFHLAVQAAFGWENRHLYGVRGTDCAGRERRIIGPDDEAEDLQAESASAVVLSELLDPQKPGMAFDYDYDFGDSWTHRVDLVGAAELQPGEMLCVEGARRGAIEDSGGPHGYRQLIEAIQDPSHPDHQEATSWAYGMTGLYGHRFDPAAFDLHAANRKLRMLSLQWWPQPLGDPERDSVLRPVRWLLHEASGDGVELTKDGYLKPALVKRAMEELGWAHPAMGKGNRETHARQVAELRQHLMDWKLLSKRKGRLVLSPRGRRGLERPEDLWDYVVDEIARPQHPGVYLVTLLQVHWHLTGIEPPYAFQAGIIHEDLRMAGMVTRSGDPIPEEWGADINRTVRWSLECLHLTEPARDSMGPPLLTDGGVKFLLDVVDRARTFPPAGLRLERHFP